MKLSFLELKDGGEVESIESSLLLRLRDSNFTFRGRLVQPETVDDYNEYSYKEGSNISGGAEEGSSSHSQHLDAKSEETSRMNLPKLREWSKDHPWLLVLEDPDRWVTMGATEHECLIFGFLSEEEPEKVEEALMDPDWVIARQDELSRIER